MNHSQPHLEIVPSDSLPRFPLDDDSEPRLVDDPSDMATTIEMRPTIEVSPDDLCEIGVRTSATSSRPLWNIKAAFPHRPELRTVSIRERHPMFFRVGVPAIASAVAFFATLVLAFVFHASLEAGFAALLGQ